MRIAPLWTESHMALVESDIVRFLNESFSEGEWPSCRFLRRNVRDRNAFFTANILGILDRCRIQDRRLLENMGFAKEKIKRYRRGHLTYFWPFSNGFSMIPNAPLLGRLRVAALSPDADDTCLSQIALREKAVVDRVVDELIFYRNDGSRFQLPKFQRDLPAAENTFLTFFPPREHCRPGTLETIDAGTDANILWLLGSFGLLSAPGARETINFIREVLSTDLIFTDTYKVSQYYPYPLVILYLVSRAVRWGGIHSLDTMKDRILFLTRRIPSRSAWDHLLCASIGMYWRSSSFARPHVEALERIGLEPAPFFTFSYLTWLAIRIPAFEVLARNLRTHFKFKCQALQMAMFLWMIQEYQQK